MWEKVGKAGPFSHQSPAFSQVKPPLNPPLPISTRFPPASWQFSRFPVHCLFRIRACPCSIRGQPITPRLLHSVSPHHSLTPQLQYSILCFHAHHPATFGWTKAVHVDFYCEAGFLPTPSISSEIISTFKRL